VLFADDFEISYKDMYSDFISGWRNGRIENYNRNGWNFSNATRCKTNAKTETVI
jgi:hypothetical protein